MKKCHLQSLTIVVVLITILHCKMINYSCQNLMAELSSTKTPLCDALKTTMSLLSYFLYVLSIAAYAE